ncbi:MAG: hypothetical protein WBA93_27980 [Microcoleaceae cyanobacterium]
MSENKQQRDRIAKALNNRGLEPTEQAINSVIELGGTTAAVNQYTESIQPQPQQSSSHEEMSVTEPTISQGSQVFNEIVDTISEKNSDELADAITAMTVIKAAHKAEQGYVGDRSQQAIESLKSKFSNIFGQTVNFVQIQQTQMLNQGKAPALMEGGDSPKLLESKN